jgi:plasmid maintenance system killer protein
VTGAEPIKNVTKKQQKFRKELQIRLLKIEEVENNKKLRKKLSNNNKKTKNQERKGKSTRLGRTPASGNRERGK